MVGRTSILVPHVGRKVLFWFQLRKRTKTDVFDDYIRMWSSLRSPFLGWQSFTSHRNNEIELSSAALQSKYKLSNLWSARPSTFCTVSRNIRKTSITVISYNWRILRKPSRLSLRPRVSFIFDLECSFLALSRNMSVPALAVIPLPFQCVKVGMNTCIA